MRGTLSMCLEDLSKNSTIQSENSTDLQILKGLKLRQLKMNSIHSLMKYMKNALKNVRKSSKSTEGTLIKTIKEIKVRLSSSLTRNMMIVTIVVI